jgi:SAM-dependent methyltransferase
VQTFAEIHRVLRPAGTFLIHLPMHSFPACNRYPRALFRAAYAAFLQLSSLNALVRRLVLRWFGWGYMHGISHELVCLVTTLRSLGFYDLGVTFLVEDGIQPCVYGRKAYPAAA